MIVTKEALVSEPSLSKQEIKQAFITLPTARKKRNIKKHKKVKV